MNVYYYADKMQTKALGKPVSMQVVDTNFLYCLGEEENTRIIYVLKKCV